MYAQILFKQFGKPPYVPDFGPMSFSSLNCFMIGRDVILSHFLKQKILLVTENELYKWLSLFLKSTHIHTHLPSALQLQ